MPVKEESFGQTPLSPWMRNNHNLLPELDTNTPMSPWMRNNHDTLLPDGFTTESNGIGQAPLTPSWMRNAHSMLPEMGITESNAIGQVNRRADNNDTNQVHTNQVLPNQVHPNQVLPPNQVHQELELALFIQRIAALESEKGAIQADLAEEQRVNRNLTSKLEQCESNLKDMTTRFEEQRQHAKELEEKLEQAKNWQGNANDTHWQFDTFRHRAEELEHKLHVSERTALDAEVLRRDAEDRLRQSLAHSQRKVEVRPAEASAAVVQEMARRTEEQRRRIAELEQKLGDRQAITGLLDDAGDYSSDLTLRDPLYRSDLQRRRIGQLEIEVAKLRSTLANSEFQAMACRSSDQLRRIGHLERDIRDQENQLQMLKDKPGSWIQKPAQKQIADLNAQIKRERDKHRESMQGMEQASKIHRLEKQASEKRIKELSNEAKELEARLLVKTQEYADLEIRTDAVNTERQAGIARICELVEKNKDLEEISAKYSVSAKTLMTLEGMLKAERQQRETVQKASEHVGVEHVGLEHIRPNTAWDSYDYCFMEASRKHRIAMDATLNDLQSNHVYPMRRD